MNKTFRRKGLSPRAGEEPSSSWASRPDAVRRSTPWVARLTDVSSATRQQSSAWTHSLRGWQRTNPDALARYSAHAVVLVAITVALGLSHLRVGDLRLPSLPGPMAATAASNLGGDLAAAPPDSETFLQRAVVPRTTSAVRILATAGDRSAAPGPLALPAASPSASSLGSATDDLRAERPARSIRPPDAAATATLDKLMKTYVAENGDTLLGIAYKEDVSLEAILSANLWLTNGLNTMFHPGDEFLIPPPGGIIHVVKYGDTLESIAQKYQVEAKNLVDYKPNRVASDDDLFPDQWLFVSDGTYNIAQPKPKANTLASVLQPRTNTATNTTSSNSAAPVVGSGYLRTPLYGYTITQYFWAYHTGIDLAAPIGTPIYAADGGRVVYSGWDNTGYGYTVLIDHGNGIRTRYAHMSWIFPNYGAYVQKGEQIGRVGSTGRSSGPHLHFEVIVGGIARNPFNYIGG